MSIARIPTPSGRAPAILICKCHSGWVVVNVRHVKNTSIYILLDRQISTLIWPHEHDCKEDATAVVPVGMHGSRKEV